MPTGPTAKYRICYALAVTVSLMQLSGCAHTVKKTAGAGDGQVEVDDVDSLETFNRVMYKFNYGVDTLILKPITTGYRFIMPARGRIMVTNVVENLYSPVVFANSVMQGDPKNSFATLWRFVLNTTFGLGGTVDFAANAGLKARSADFGETMAMYGTDTGPYIVLPFMGPSNGRDAIGRAVDSFLDPLNYAGLEVTIPRTVVEAVDARSRNGKLLDDVYENSIDPYSTFRSAYIQKRASDIRHAEADRQKALEQMSGKQ